MKIRLTLETDMKKLFESKKALLLDQVQVNVLGHQVYLMQKLFYSKLL